MSKAEGPGGRIDATVGGSDALIGPDSSPAEVDAGLSGEADALVASIVARINIGGEAHTGIDYPGQWAADQGECSAAINYQVGDAMHNTADDALFELQRYGNPVSCNIGGGNLAVGDYRVVLYFGETYRGPNCPGGVGERVFDILIEGNEVLSNLDLFAEGEGCMASSVSMTGHPVIKSFDVAVSDGTVNITMPRDAVNAMAAAVEVFAL